MITTKQINVILKIDDPFKAPNAMMERLLNKNERKVMFLEFLDLDSDVSKDWFKEYFENEQAERKSKKQDFTPVEVSELLNRLVQTNEDNYFESAAGTGGILINHWWHKTINDYPWRYKPSEHFHVVEELSDRAVPFLIFNMAIRGMNGIIFHGDSLTRKCKQIYFIQNTDDFSLSFSNVNTMPRTEHVKHEFNVSEWVGEPIEHIESEMTNELKQTWLDVVNSMECKINE